MPPPFRPAALPLLLALAARADFPAPYDSQADDGKRMPAEEVAAKWRVPEGFQVSVFAAEPDIRQPIAACWDARGRLWVGENYTYAQAGLEFDLSLNDRIVILEDKNNDGKHDVRTVFADNLKMLTSVELGAGGVYALCPPQLLWIPMRDDKPAGPPVVLLDGFATVKGNRHTFANGLKWGPDGWLYGRVGISSPGKIGPPGQADADRVRMNGGIWRYHPAARVFEAVCHGTTNPWGLDWDENGEGFFVNTVIGHVWHLLPGAHFKRMHGEDVNPRCYEFIDPIADHYHFDTGKGWTSSRDAANGSDALGGGHAHCGALIYKGTNWPAYWRGKLLTLNLHGRRINVERLERNGCTFTARHEPDAFFCPDPWFRGIDLLEGPDGGVYVLDWSDTGECHDHDGVHRGSGRIYKIAFGRASVLERQDLGTESDARLVQRVQSDRGWSSTMASRQLHERMAKPGLAATAREEIQAMTDSAGKNPSFALHLVRLAMIGSDLESDTTYCTTAIGSTNEYLRAGVLRSLFENVPNPWNVNSLAMTSLAHSSSNDRREIPFLKMHLEKESSVFVMMRGLAFLRNINATISHAKEMANNYEKDDRFHVMGLFPQDIAEQWQDIHTMVLPVAGRVGNNDKVAGLLLWQLMQPAVEQAPRFWRYYANSNLPKTTLRHFARLVAELSLENQALAADFFGSLGRFSADEKRSIVSSINLAWQGRRNLPKPTGWDTFAQPILSGTSEHGPDRALREAVIRLAARLEGGNASLDELRALAKDGKADPLARRNALQSLVDARAEGLQDLCKNLIGDSAVAPIAARGLALSEDAWIGPLLASRYKWSSTAKPVFLEVLASRPAWALALLDAIGKGDIAARDLPVFLARQIAALPDEKVRARLREVWGEVRADPAGMREKIAVWKARLTPETLAKADLRAGRAVFTQACATCHVLYGAGGGIGPDLTGGGRRNLDYLLENVVDPSAVVTLENRVCIVTLKDGRVLNGSVTRRDAPVLELRTLAGLEKIDRADVAKIEDLPASLMPEGLFDALTPEQVRDLVGYLMHDGQVE